MEANRCLVILVGWAITAGTANAQLTITTSGQIGIGTSTPDGYSKLHVQHNNYYAGYFTSSKTSATTRVVYAEYTGGGSYDARAVFGSANAAPGYGSGGFFTGGYRGIYAAATMSGAGIRYGIYASGNGGSTNYAGYFSGNVTVTGTFSNPSDEILKENIDSLRAVLSELTRLRPISFEYTSDLKYQHMNLSSGRQFGFIAQEVEKVFPNLVITGSHPSAEELAGEEGGEPIVYKSINYVALIPVLVEAIKEQQEMIEQLKAQMNELGQR